MTKKPSLSTIAKMAGVSKPVVYTVLNNREGKIGASPKTREKILKIAGEVGYVASKSGRELFFGKTDTIGVILHTNIPPFSELVSCLQQEARRKNLEITVYITNIDEDLEEYYLNSARDGRVDAVIALARLDGSIERYKRFSRPPYNLKIIYYSEPAIPGIPGISFDEIAVGRLAARHLTEIGCQKPVFFGTLKNSVREKGFIEYFKEKRLPVPSSIFTSRGQQDYSFAEAQSLAREFLKLKYLPDGVFVAYDMLAAALIVEAAKKGIRVPEDMAIMGCDNTDLGLCVAPTLTSIDLNIPLTAKKTIEKVADMIAGKPIKPFHTRLPVSLVVRESTKT